MPMLALALALSLTASAGAQEPAPGPGAPAAAVAPAPTPFVPGEQMLFDVEFGGLKMGEARIVVGQRVGALLPVSLEAKTTGIIGIISLRQYLVSNLDTATGLPRSNRIEGIEPGYRHVDTASFDRVGDLATVREVGKYDNTYKIEVPPGTLDFVALVFKLRTLPIEPGTVYEFPVLAGRTVSKVKATVEAREKVETGSGEVPAIRVRVPTGLSGKFSEKAPSFVWFSDDARRSVVRISTSFAIGRGVAVQVSYKAGSEGGG
jgi:hypothetical protein